LYAVVQSEIGRTNVTDQPHRSGNVPQHDQKKWSFTPSAFTLIIGLAVIVGYAAGTRNDQIINTIAPTLGIRVETGKLDLTSVQNTYQKLKANFDGTVDEAALVSGASRGLVAAAGDPHTVYFDKKEAEAFSDDLNGKIGGGIGAEIGLRDDRPTVIRALKDSPAEKAGLRPDDRIVAVNDESAGSWTLDQTIKKIRGEIGTTVKLTVLRDGNPQDFTITRQEVNQPSVESRVQGSIGILEISRFDQGTGEAARKAAQSFRDQNVKGVVLDLRGNGGGTLEAAPEVASLWLNDQVVVSERRNGKIEAEQKSDTNPLLAGLPTVVLVNGSTASASEIVTAALKDYNVATVIGEKTYGKGTVQAQIDLPDNALLKVTVQRWFTPKGNNLDKKGITPDQTVGLTRDDVNAGKDPQLDMALQKLAQ
jgi:carboxyl-terminal processing protease